MNDKRRKDLYIYIYICRERERKGNKRVWGEGRGRASGIREGGETGGGLRVKKGKEEVKTKLKGKIFIQHQTTASV